uniref:RBR-type E3 ubiquitin transferase n=1 Tax=Chenopodium quinoa TaxID=63459 RepID=A0A803M8V8_CHEQI
MVAEIEPIEIMFLCEICADSKPQKEAFKIKGCSHSYCSDCMKTYVASKLQDGVSIINCPVPSCSGVLEPEYCRDILPFEVFARWGNLLCESVILATQKFYCPFKDCSALLVDDGFEKVTMSECPSCFRLFCAQCKVGWHADIECAEYQSLNKDEREKEDIMLRKLAKIKNWQRCPKCKYYVEKSEGCLYMKCRCGLATSSFNELLSKGIL